MQNFLRPLRIDEVDALPAHDSVCVRESGAVVAVFSGPNSEVCADFFVKRGVLWVIY